MLSECGQYVCEMAIYINMRDGELDADVTRRLGGITGRECLECCVIENESEDQWEDVQDSGKTTGVQGRDRGIEEGTGKEIGGCRNMNAKMDVRSYKAKHDQK